MVKGAGIEREVLKEGEGLRVIGETKYAENTVWGLENGKRVRVGGGTHLESITYRIEVASTCPDCGEGVKVEGEDFFTTAATVTVVPCPPVGEEHPTRFRVWQRDEWVEDPEVMSEIAAVLIAAALQGKSEEPV